MVWSQLLNSKEFWGAMAAGIPVLTALIGGAVKSLKGDGTSKKAKATRIQEVLEKNKEFLGKEDIRFLENRINYYVMQPVAKFHQKRYRAKYIFLMNRSNGQLNSLRWQKLISHIQYDFISKKFFLDYTSREFLKERKKLRTVAVFYMSISIFVLISMLMDKMAIQLPIDESYVFNYKGISKINDYLRLFSLLTYIPFSVYCWYGMPNDKKAKEISRKLNEIDTSDYSSQTDFY
ncbi:hypothetical protein [Klebsiella aerogenes]|uniref:hypothetical protein n=2 Tax=Klebsiella aerogenes TaxID=548 RepID=UPI000DA1FD00|nr:hypothetical protein [Klebsiella aerogenes]HCB2856825.1 hypothetical protein [Klebsiella aerogenes]HCB2863443.1 hypothetical protein [Klebsiella aerogenes]HCB2880031.1 hypothetical protein [Klebsiella aerogenes]HCB3341436.1 hypothetical protein [Klebsiella aerogenes]HCM1808893.1 hypothetical protein [Klebsiella aerogenes]